MYCIVRFWRKHFREIKVLGNGHVENLAKKGVKKIVFVELSIRGMRRTRAWFSTGSFSQSGLHDGENGP